MGDIMQVNLVMIIPCSVFSGPLGENPPQISNPSQMDKFNL